MKCVSVIQRGCVLAVLLFAGCAVQEPLYHWGHYESLIYAMYMKPGEADPVMQVDRLTADIQQAEAAGKRVPPGVFAHLGFMYAIQGDEVRAEEAFREEKNLYPESAVLIDGMLARARLQAQAVNP